jgi:hypothetical protein
MGRSWNKIRAELREELIAADHADVWQTVEKYLPGGVFSRYHMMILLRHIEELHGPSGLRAFEEAFSRLGLAGWQKD